MTLKYLTAVVLGAALAGPAFAQGQPQSQSSGQQRQQGQNQQQQAMGQERLRQQLTQAGFRDVQILDTAYLVQARTQDGNTVLMTINPPSAGSQTSGSSGTPGGGSSGGSGSGSGGGQQGSGSGRTQ